MQNLGGSPASIVVSWDLPLQTTTGFLIYAVKQSQNTGEDTWEMVGEAGPTATSFMHSELFSGSLYTYRVRALDIAGLEDTNTKSLSTVAFEGISEVYITGKTTAQVRVNSAVGSFDEIRVYAEPSKGGGLKKLVGRISGSSLSVNITDLRSGTTYKFSAQAYMAFMGREDGNEIYKVAQTYSESFGSGAATETQSSFAYRGFMNIRAFGEAPKAPVDDMFPERTPRVRLVSLTWLPFNGAGGSTRYRVFRAKAGESINTATTTTCSATVENSCIVVCNKTASPPTTDKTGAGPLTCIDYDIPDFDAAVSTKNFNYAVSLVKTMPVNVEWAEELPLVNTSDFMVSVHIPPDNMALVQRDAANYEQCQLMNKTSDPRKKQRCSYTGLGAVPKSSGPTRPDLNLSASYFDFGYNMFVDRWPMSCNFSRAADGATCGPGGGVGDCIGFGELGNPGANDPDFALKGREGDVFLHFGVSANHVACWVKKNSSWIRLDGGGLVESDYKKALTSEPGPTSAVPFVGGNNTYPYCSGFENAYGNKRLLRRREYVAAMGLPWMSGEPFAPTNPSSYNRHVIGSFEGVGAGYRQCYATSTDIVSLVPATSYPDVESAKTAFLNGQFNDRQGAYVGGQFYGWPNNSMLAGSPYTVSCTSRFGIADVKNNVRRTLLSDLFIRRSDVTVPGVTGAVLDLEGVLNPMDPGNTDLVGFHFDGGYTRGWSSVVPPLNASGPAGFVQSFTGLYSPSSSASTYSFVNTILGVPLSKKTTADAEAISYTDFDTIRMCQGESFSVTENFIVNSGGYVQRISVNGTTSMIAQGRWDFRFSFGIVTGIRCAQEAE